jgi:hypothetical protein
MRPAFRDVNAWLNTWTPEGWGDFLPWTFWKRELKTEQQVLGKTNRRLSFDTTRTAKKKRLEQFFVTAGERLFWNTGGTYRPTDLPLLGHGPQIKRRLQQFFDAAGMSLLSCYSGTLGVYTDPQTFLC